VKRASSVGHCRVEALLGMCVCENLAIDVAKGVKDLPGIVRLEWNLQTKSRSYDVASTLDVDGVGKMPSVMAKGFCG